MRTITKAIALLIAFSTVTLAQEKGTFTDTRDKKKYKTVKIGEQVWMAENLNYNATGSKCYGEGGKVMGQYDKVALPKAKIQAYCTQYGRLYDEETALKACPKGWHLPRKREWNELLRFVDSTGKETGKRLKAKSGWEEGDFKGYNGTDTYGFSALPGGTTFGGDFFERVGQQGCWWSGTATTRVFLDIGRTNKGNVYSIKTNSGYFGITIDRNNDARNGTGYYSSIRCIQGDEESVAKIDAEDKAEAEAEAAKQREEAEKQKAEGEAREKAAKEKAEAEAKAKTEAEAKAKAEAIAEAAVPFKDTRDGKTYKKFIYNSTIWMAENLNYEAKGSKCYDNKPDNCKKYGRLYDYETAKKACPAGWRLPTRKEAFESGKVDLKSGSGWDDYQGKSGGGTNEIGFTALPGGYYGPDFFTGKKINFYDIGKGARWWSDATNIAYTFGVSNSSKDISTYSQDSKDAFYSVRCVNNTPSIIPRYP